MSRRVNRLAIYTDGGASPNPGPGGWAAVLLTPAAGGGEPAVRELSGGEPHTTNNRMELTAALRALEALDPGARVDLHTDSRYLRQGITRWLARWVADGWRKRDGKAVLNADLWRRLEAAADEHQVRWHWVKGHSGDRWNERADELATAAAEAYRSTAAAVTAGGAASGGDAEADARIHLKASGRGLWAARVDRGDGDELLTGGDRRASANELLLVAAAEALESLPEGLAVAVYTTADYLRQGAAEWLPGWKRRGWRTAGGGAVKNRDAWQRLERAMVRRRVVWPRPDDDAAAEIDALGKGLRKR